MEDLGELGFWLAAGMALAAWIISEGLKERGKEHEKQATIREMMRLEAEGKLTPETLKYMRERDEAERLAAEQKAAREREAGDPVGAGILAFFVGLISFAGGLAAFALILRAMGGPAPVSLLISVSAILLVWAGGLRLAILTYRAVRGRKKAPQKEPRPGA